MSTSSMVRYSNLTNGNEHGLLSKMYSASCKISTQSMGQLKMFECYHNVVTDKENSDCMRNADIF